MSNLLNLLFHDEAKLITLMSYILIIFSVVVFIIQFFYMAPYGRYASSSWGRPVSARLAWFIQELPAFFVPLCLYTTRSKMIGSANSVLLLMYLLHYFHRCFIFPFLIRGGKPTPLFVFIMAFVFCACNGYMQGCHLIKYNDLPQNWTSHPLFISGVILFVFGLCVNIHSDHILRNLRKNGDTGYKIPYGGFFQYVSGANFFGETIEWLGFAMACCSLPALAFACSTVATLTPRAVSHHRWYLDKFREDYPKNRKAVVPFLF